MLRGLFTTFSNFLSLKPLKLGVYGNRNSLVFAPFYHLVSPQTPLHIKHLYPVITPEQFEEDLEFMLKHFSPVEANDLLPLANGEKRTHKPPLFLSFDDGFRELTTVVAPILLAKGIPATFFVSPAFVGSKDMLYRCKQSIIIEKVRTLGNSFKAPNFLIELWGKGIERKKVFERKLLNLNYNHTELIERIAKEFEIDFKSYLIKQQPYLSLEELNGLARQGFTIGAHGVDHPSFADIPFEQQVYQVEQSLEWVQTNIPNQPRMFAFPFTDFGLGREFYRHFLVENPNVCNMFFGTAGLKPTSHSQFIHRVPMEVKGKSARQVIKGEFFYYIAKRLVGKHKASIPV